MHRRDVLIWGAMTILRPTAAWSKPDRSNRTTPDSMWRNRIGVTTVSLRDIFPMRIGSAVPKQPRSLLEAPAFIADKLNIRNLELWNLQFDDVSDDFMRRLRTAADAAGSRITNIQIDDGGDLSSSEEAVRRRSLEDTKAWIDRAALLGASSLRQNFGPADATGDFPLQQVAASFRELADYGQAAGITVLVENHVGHSRNIENVKALLTAVDHANLRAIIDWGNTSVSNTEVLIESVGQLAPWLYLVSAKVATFDIDYRPVDYDIASIVRATESWGYRGLYSIELWGDPPPDFNSVRAISEVAEIIGGVLKEGRT